MPDYGTYQTWYQDLQSGSWVNMGDNNYADGLIPGETYRIRMRFSLSHMYPNQTGYDLAFRLLHNPTNLSDFSFNVLDQNGSINSQVTYDSITATNNAANTTTFINIYNLRSQEVNFVQITFLYRCSASPDGSNPYNGVITANVNQFTMTETSVQSVIADLKASIQSKFNQLNHVIEQMGGNITTSIDNQTTFLGGAFNGIATTVSNLFGSLFNNLTSLFTTLNNNLFDWFMDLQDTLYDFFSDFFSNLLDTIIDGLKSLFIPEDDELKDWVDDFYQELQEDCPILAEFVGVFIDTFDLLSNGSIKNYFDVPEVTLNFGDDTFLLGGWKVYLFPTGHGMDVILGYMRTFTSLILCLAIFNMMWRRVLATLGFTTEINNTLEEQGGV